MPIIPAFLRTSRLLHSAEIRTIEEVLHEWQKDGVGRTVAPNLHQREHFLPRRHMLPLLRAVLGARGAPVQELADQYQRECYNHQRRGGRIRVRPYPEYLGRAVERPVFVKYLLKNYRKVFRKRDHAEDLVDRLRSGAPIDPRHEEVLLSQYTAWVTWRESDPTQDPFGFVQHGMAVEVRAALGLDPRFMGSLLLLRYRRPADLELNRPTVADAGLYPLFDPPMSTEKKHSRTRPWPYFPVRQSPPRFGTADPCPEAVHGPVRMGVLSDTVQELS